MQLHDVESQEDLRQMYEERGANIRKVLNEKRANGEPIGMPPVGYRIVRSPNGSKRVEVDPIAGPLIQEARELYASGNYSVRRLLKIMTTKGLKSRNGKSMDASGLWRILTRQAHQTPLTENPLLHRKGNL